MDLDDNKQWRDQGGRGGEGDCPPCKIVHKSYIFHVFLQAYQINEVTKEKVFDFLCVTVCKLCERRFPAVSDKNSGNRHCRATGSCQRRFVADLSIYRCRSDIALLFFQYNSTIITTTIVAIIADSVRTVLVTAFQASALHYDVITYDVIKLLPPLEQGLPPCCPPCKMNLVTPLDNRYFGAFWYGRRRHE